MKDSETSTTQALVPPRPNLGPEPWPSETRPIAWPWLALIVVAIAMISLFFRQQRRSRLLQPASIVAPVELPEPLTHRERMIRWNEAVRRHLVDRFGTAWSAKTTEEIAIEENLSASFGPDATLLLSFLRASDLAKFSGIEIDAHPAEDWAPWVARFVTNGSSSDAGERPATSPDVT